MIRLSGSIFVRNAIKFDYCIIESICSLLGVCDEVVVLECSSEDDTLKLLRSISSPKLKIYSDAPWDIAPDSSRLSMLANLAKERTEGRYHFMLQADEVLHESSYVAINQCVSFDIEHSVSVRRVNFYGDPHRHVKYDLPLHEKPCDDHPTRLGLREFDALGDGESIGKRNDLFDENIVICHYGFVRDGLKLVDRTVESLKWFHAHPVPDERFLKMQADKRYRYTDIMRPDQLQPYAGTHPKIIQPWLEERWK